MLIEYVVSNVTNDNLIDMRLTEAQVNAILSALQHKSLKSYERMIKQYTYNNMFYEISHSNEQDPPEIKAYSKSIQSISETNHKNINKIISTKQKIAVHAFPSCTEIHHISYIKRLVFRKTNRAFLNIEHHNDVEDYKFWKCYVNANIDDNTDKDFIVLELTPLLNLLQEALEASTS